MPPTGRLAFAIAMGVRRGDTALRDALDAVLVRRAAATIDAMLDEYGVPRVTRQVGAQLRKSDVALPRVIAAPAGGGLRARATRSSSSPDDRPTVRHRSRWSEPVTRDSIGGNAADPRSHAYREADNAQSLAEGKRLYTGSTATAATPTAAAASGPR